VAQELVRAGVDRDDGIEDAGLRVGIEAEEDFCERPLSVVRCPLHIGSIPLNNGQLTTNGEQYD
jgi:hypothetical protein